MTILSRREPGFRSGPAPVTDTQPVVYDSQYSVRFFYINNPLAPNEAGKTEGGPGGRHTWAARTSRLAASEVKEDRGGKGERGA